MGNEDSSGETVENANGSREETTTRGGLGGTQYKLLRHLGQSCYVYLQIDWVVTSVFIGGELQIDQVVTSVFIGGELQIYQVVTSVFIGGEAQVGGIMWTPTEIGQVVNQCFIGGGARMSKRLEAVSKRNKLKVSYNTFFKLLKWRWASFLQ